MNRCYDSDCYDQEEELHYSDHFLEEDETSETSESSFDDDSSLAPSVTQSLSLDLKNSPPVLSSLTPRSSLNSFCPYPKTVAPSSACPVPPVVEENTFFEKDC